MGSIAGSKIGTMIRGKSKRERNNKDFVHGTSKEGLGFWRKIRFFLSCLSLNSKREESSNDKGKQSDGTKVANDNVRHQPYTPSSSSSKMSRNCSRSSPNPNLNMELRLASWTPSLSMELTLASSGLQRFTFDDLKLATRNFSDENFLGEGGFGDVFKGWISQHENNTTRPGTMIPIAVKNLNLNGHQGHKEWLTEITYLSELHHQNLIKLVGFCIEDDKRLLVYEFMYRGSLESHLFKRFTCLPWSIRKKIMIGVAEGLAFLHEEGVIFRDFKASNILLDEYYNAKLSDFGLATNAPVGNATHVSIQVMGTKGYTAPEYIATGFLEVLTVPVAATGHLTCKCDVYSFGVVLLEMLAGRRVVEKRRPKEEQNLVQWLSLLLRREANLRHLMDPRLQGKYPMIGADKAIKLAVRCLRSDPKARPHMSEVVRMLESLPVQDNGVASSSTSTPAPSIPLSSLNRMHVGPSNHGVNKYGLKTSLAPKPNVPRRFQASPLSQDNPLPPPNPSVRHFHK